jgi:hypothetical protein
MIWEIRTSKQILVGKSTEKLPVEDGHGSRIISAWILRKWIQGRKTGGISLSPVTYFSTNDVTLQIPLQCYWHK